MKILAAVLVILYLYTLSFGIFMTDIFRIPAPLIFCIPLIFLFREKEKIEFLYSSELILFGLAILLYNVIGLSELIVFIAYIMCIGLCSFYFNFFVGTNKMRFNITIYVFIALLSISAVVMVFNPYFLLEINNIRSILMGEPVMQSPSGIAVYQFNFGYQLAALVPFLLIYTFVYKKPLLFKVFILCICLLFIYLGMQRSVFVGFICSAFLFLLMYYNFKAIFITALAIGAAFVFYTYVLKDNLDSYNNIITKNENNMQEYNRSTLALENLRIYSGYPYGLIFYGKNWSDVIYRNEVFSSGITSHNAYLMFLTYLGPFLGLGILIGLYHRIWKIIIDAFRNVRKKEYALIICLCCSFIAVSINSLSHNSWLVSANGPTIFLYFAILHLNFLLKRETEPEVELNITQDIRTQHS
ncbi:hypothetical protein IWX76_000943 [Pedobacter sp. CAN_A7]|uniref:hypothetical protein n=1 Tax=Pedobacter sp. CAN_A7 TaxID=2787722 RepID=UPI0018CA1E0C